jgi:DNA polymerase III epsilon subunit family exonuclease
MEAITLTRPLGDSIINGRCRIINQFNPPPERIIGEFIAIHSGRTYNYQHAKIMRDKGLHAPPPKDSCKSGIIGVAKVAGHVTDGTNPWFKRGMFGWTIEDVSGFPAIDIPGQPGVWTVPEQVVSVLRTMWSQRTPGIVETKSNEEAPANPDWRDCTVVVIDTETTGLSKRDRVIEVGAILAKGDEIIDTLETLVFQEQPISDSARSVNGITQRMLIRAPLFRSIEGKLGDMFHAAYAFVAHNVAFDYKMLSRDIHIPQFLKVFDTMKASKSLGYKKNSLDEVIARLYITDKMKGVRHRAGHDARLCWEVFKAYGHGRTVADMNHGTIGSYVTIKHDELMGLYQKFHR